MSNPQAPRAPAPQQQNAPLLKAEDVPKLQCLSDDMKQKYRPVVQNLWHMMQQHPAGSDEHTSSRKKLQEWSTKLINQERNHRSRIKAAQQQQSQGQPSQSDPQAAKPANAESQQQQPPRPQTQQPPANPAQGARPPQANQQQPTIEPEILRHVQTFQFNLPVDGPQMGTPAGDAKIKQDRNSYAMALNKNHKLSQRIKLMSNMVTQKEQAGQEIPPELVTSKQQIEKEYNATKEFIETFRKRQAENKQAQDQRRAQQTQGQQPQQSQPAAPQQRQPSQPNIKEEPQIKIEGGQAPQTSSAQQTQQFVPMQTQPQQQQQQQQPPPNAQAQLPIQQQPPQPLQQQAQPQQPPPQPMRQPPMPHLQQNQPQPQFAQPGPPQRPPINPHQANSMPQVHQQNNSPHPQSANSNAGGPPAPLSHQAAVSAAQRSYSNQEAQRTTTPMQAGGNFHNPGSREREQMNNPKMPIPRTLQTAPPTPIGMGQARPTMSGPTNGAPGPMGQPVISKFPPFQLEGENDRVLSKRKLDELVRQVTGGSEDALTPEVEEAVLQLADDFVDTVIGNACKLSKLRESSQLDVRDIQLVIERNYNIRIPGYSSDEVRTVRRLVPAPGWTQKMNAVQAAKVMGGKNDI